jgi:hypothetical protein
VLARASKAEARAFCDCLGRAARAAAAAPWRIVLALRDDLLDRLVAAPAMRPHLGAVMRLGPLSAADLRAAVAAPLASAGYGVDAPELVDQLVADVAGQPGCLALLQLACQALWERRDVASRRLLGSEYDAMGGAAGALAARARRLTTELAADEVPVARAVLLALFDADGAHRPRPRAEVIALVPARSRDVAGRLVDRLLERGVLVAASPAVTLALAHGALDAAWPQLARWLDETHEARRALARLEDAALAWQRRGRRADATWSGAALARLARQLREAGLAVPPLARAFLAACLRREGRLRRRWGWLAAVTAAVAIALAAAARIFRSTST